MDNSNRFLELSDIDRMLERVTDDILKRHDTEEEANKEIQEFEDKIVSELSTLILDDVASYSDDQSKLFDMKLEEAKSKFIKYLPNTFSFLKNIFLKSHEIYDYLIENTGIKDEKGTVTCKDNEIIKFCLIRNYYKFLETFSEIIVLAERGMVFGAEARWRQLNELAVISTVIAEEKDVELTFRYLQHDNIGMKKGANLVEYYKEHYPDLLKSVNEKYNELKNKYGEKYVKKPYGWYSPNENINFHDLAIKYHHKNLLGYVKIANMSSHASSYTLGDFEVSTLKERINYLEVILQNIMINIHQITATTIYYYLHENDIVTVSGVAIADFYRKSFGRFVEYYFNERHEVDMSKPKYKDLPHHSS